MVKQKCEENGFEYLKYTCNKSNETNYETIYKKIWKKGKKLLPEWKC